MLKFSVDDESESSFSLWVRIRSRWSAEAGGGGEMEVGGGEKEAGREIDDGSAGTLEGEVY